MRLLQEIRDETFYAFIYLFGYLKRTSEMDVILLSFCINIKSGLVSEFHVG